MERVRRWLSLALVLVLALSVMAVTAFAAGETVTVCFVPSKDWKQDNVWFAAYCWNDSGSQWVRLTQDGFCYTGEIPVEYTNIIFARMASNQTEMNWDNRWTQTGDLVLDPAKPCFVKGSGWEDSSGNVVDNTLHIINTKFVLPDTGGMGTTVFTVAGLGIIAAACMLLLINRKRKTC